MKTEARRLLHLDRPDQAVTVLQSGMAQMGADAESHGLMGAALARVGEDSVAVSHFEQAVRMDPSRASNHYNLGVAYEKTAHPEWALEGYRQALLRDPQFEQAYIAYYRLASMLAAQPHESPLPSPEQTITAQMSTLPQPETIQAVPPVLITESASKGVETESTGVFDRTTLSDDERTE